MAEKIRFGITGTNFISEWMNEGALLDPRFEVTAVCSRSQERAVAFAAKHGIPFAFTSFEQMVASDCIDAVYIATPNSLHARQSIMAMNAGKHVLCEKPFASNAREASMMIEASERNGVALMEAMRTTLMPAFSAVRKNIALVGKPRGYEATYCQYSSRYDRLKNGELPNAFNPQFAAGALMDIGCYTIYPMVVLFGMPMQVKASGVKLASGVDGMGSAIFSYPDMTAVTLYSKITDSTLPAEILGENGTISIDSISDPTSAVFRPRKQNVAGGRGVAAAETILCDAPHLNRYYYEMKEFIDLIESGRRESAVNSHVASLNTMEILDEIRRQLGVVFPGDSPDA